MGLFAKNGNISTFTWIDGTPLTDGQNMFGSGEPRKSNSQKLDYVAVHSDMSWHSYRGKSLKGYGCQRTKSSEL